MSGSLPPGWYPAPGSSSALGWWDGIRWTGEVRDADDAGDAGTPAAALGASSAGAGVGTAAAAAGQALASGPSDAAEARATWRAPAVDAWQARTATEPPRRLGRWLGKGRRFGKARDSGNAP